MKPLHAAYALLVMIIWGVNFVAAKIGLYEIPPLMLVGVRFALVAVLLLPFARPPRGQWLGVAILSVTMGSLHFGLMFSGIEGVDASVAAIAIQMQVPFAALLAAIVFRDYLGWPRLFGMALAFAGIVVLAGEPRHSTDLLPLALVVLASMMWGMSNVIIKRLGPFDGMTLNAYLAALTAPQLLLASLVLEPGSVDALLGATWWAYGSILFMAVIVTIVGYGLWYILVPLYDVNQTVPYTLLVPVFGVASGVVMLGEELTWAMVIGGAATLGGVAIIILRRPRTVAPAAAAER